MVKPPFRFAHDRGSIPASVSGEFSNARPKIAWRRGVRGRKSAIDVSVSQRNIRLLDSAIRARPASVIPTPGGGRNRRPAKIGISAELDRPGAAPRQARRHLGPPCSDPGSSGTRWNRRTPCGARVPRAPRTGWKPALQLPSLLRVHLERSHWVENGARLWPNVQASGRSLELVRHAAPRCSRRWFHGKSAAHHSPSEWGRADEGAEERSRAGFLCEILIWVGTFRFSVLPPVRPAIGRRGTARSQRNSDRSWDSLFHLFPFIPSGGGLPHTSARSALTLDFSRPARRSLALRPACSLHRPGRHIGLEGFDGFVTSTVAPIATGWSDPVAGWELHPLKGNTFSRRTQAASLFPRLRPGPPVALDRGTCHRAALSGAGAARTGARGDESCGRSHPSTEVVGEA
jgi:hypothetical protein